MRFVCDSCRAQYMISDEKVGPKGVKVRCKKCSYVILVKKADGTGKAPVSSVGADADDALATQVMQNPLTGPAETAADVTNPGFGDEKTQNAAPGAGFFSGVDEDEIGAVFDQVLNSGSHSIPRDTQANPAVGASSPRGPALGDDSDDRLSTRVLDAAVVNQLAKDSGSDDAPISGEAVDGASGPPGAAAAPAPEWFAAIDDKQTGPLSLEALRGHWSKGEIGPDSLAWKAGMPDWIPISEIAELATELAPRHSKPVVIAPTPAVSAPPAVMSVPVESAFSAGAGLSGAMRGEMQVPLGTGEEVASWRPSAASALASLVKEEMDALSKPPPPARSHPDAAMETRSSGGLIDLPGDEPRASAPARTNGHEVAVPAASSRAPANPYMSTPAATYSSPAIAQYRPAPQGRNPMVLVFAGVGVAVVALIAVIVILAMRQPAERVVIRETVPAAPAPVAPVVAAPVAPVAAAPVAVPAPAPGVAAAAPGAVAEPGAAAAAAPAAAPVAVAAVSPSVTPSRPTRSSGSGLGGGGSRAAKGDKPDERTPEPPAPAGRKGSEAKDDFDEAFGDAPSSKPAAAKKVAPSGEAQTDPKRSAGYIPPAPGGGGDAKDALSSADIMEVVLSNKSALASCASEQKKRDPGTSGKLVMKWTIQTSGKPSNVSVASEEYKSTYMASCVGGLIKSWTFPKHKKQGDPVVFPFKF